MNRKHIETIKLKSAEVRVFVDESNKQTAELIFLSDKDDVEITLKANVYIHGERHEVVNDIIATDLS